MFRARLLRRGRVAGPLLIAALEVALASTPPARAERAPRQRAAARRPAQRTAVQGGGCPTEMVAVGAFCIDRWEASLVDKATRRALSPYYPALPQQLSRVRQVWEVERASLGDESARRLPLPDLPAWQMSERFEPAAVSRPNAVPHGYLTYHVARRACENAGKRLCTEQEWVTACRGRHDTQFPYGSVHQPGRCNVHRAVHPASVLHGDASVGHTDPRLNLVTEGERDPLLRLTGATPGCASRWGDDAVLDMVGNLDEWIEDSGGTFLGGFYARSTTKGCEARIESHAASYYDYSTGTRCCKDAG